MSQTTKTMSQPTTTIRDFVTASSPLTLDPSIDSAVGVQVHLLPADAEPRFLRNFVNQIRAANILGRPLRPVVDGSFENQIPVQLDLRSCRRGLAQFLVSQTPNVSMNHLLITVLA